jgi:hypothetical protein
MVPSGQSTEAGNGAKLLFAMYIRRFGCWPRWPESQSHNDQDGNFQ